MIDAIMLLAFFCLYIGMLYPALALLGHDVYARKSKTLTTVIRWRRRGADIWQSPLLNNILKIVAPLIPLSETYEKKMNEDLARADIPYVASEYLAKAILSALAGVFVALIAASMRSFLLVGGGILMAIWLFFKNYDQLKDTLKDKFKLIENDIPAFVRSVAAGLETDRDVVHVIQQYNKIASPAMQSELELMLADMKTSTPTNALMRFDNRMNNPEISRLCAALIEVERGVDATLTLQYLAADMTTMHRELIQRELDKRPGQMKRAILPGGIILVIMMLYMLIQAVVQSVGTMI